MIFDANLDGLKNGDKFLNDTEELIEELMEAYAKQNKT